MHLVVDAFLKGVGLGLALAFSMGPAFFALLQTSIQHGVKIAIALALGVFISDLTCVILAYYGASQIFTNPGNKIIIGIAGGTILIIFGLYTLIQKKQLQDETIPGKIVITKPNIYLTAVKGYFINILNPFVLILWFGWVGLITTNEDYTNVHLFVFFATTLLTVLFTDILKAVGADKIKNLLKPNTLVLINRIFGIVMLACGILMFYRIFK